MIRVYTDASVARGGTGAAGVRFVFPGRTHMDLMFPVHGVTSNLGEIASIYLAGEFLLNNWQVMGYDPRHNFAQICTDSDAAFKAFADKTRKLNDRTRAVFKRAQQVWDNLREVGAIRGWECVKIDRSVNPADAIAKKAKRAYGGLYTWPT